MYTRNDYQRAFEKFTTNPDTMRRRYETPAAAPAIPPDVVAFIESPRTSASGLRHRYRTDPPFRKQYDLHEETKGQAQLQQSASLTVEEYRRLPAAIVVQKYRQNGAFRAQVDALIAKGLI